MARVTINPCSTVAISKTSLASDYDMKSFVVIANECRSVECVWLSLIESMTANNDSRGTNDFGNRLSNRMGMEFNKFVL